MDPVEHEDELLIPQPSLQDLHQEAELLRLQGVTPNMSILRRKMSRSDASLFGDDLPITATPIDWEVSPIPSQETLLAIAEWAIDQDDEVQGILFPFLEEPTQMGLDYVLGELERMKVIPKQRKHKGARSVSLASVIFSFIEDAGRPVRPEELFDLARGFRLARRPEATVRQILRRYTAEGKLEVHPDGYQLP